MWIYSVLPMLYIQVNAMSGFCEIKNMSLIKFQLIFMVISVCLTVLTALALKNIRRTLMEAGRSPFKLEILFYRLLIISVGISLPHICYLLGQFYDTYNVALVKLVLRTVSIIFSTLWVYSPKTFRTWNDLICSAFKSKPETRVITEKPKKKTLLKALIPKIFKNGGIPHLGPVTKV
ncbi:unnamed protein product [Brassicogethes aeneus]|uniref:Uncharacterized protein n=1 Tax=Brassicogethes aeneus TaxID=1431903 RepID=A0A9P0BKR8_BRAAE|nr:unnamed protein product [Brassicogethes aeneus]